MNPYAVSKATQDLLAYQYHASHRLRTLRMRLFNHIGPRQNEQFVVAAFAAQIARIEAGQQPPLLRVGNLTAERDFTDVRDVAQAYALAARSGQVPCAYNVGSGRCVSIRCSTSAGRRPALDRGRARPGAHATRPMCSAWSATAGCSTSILAGRPRSRSSRPWPMC